MPGKWKQSQPQGHKGKGSGSQGVQSSNVQSIGYDNRTDELTITFKNNATYLYEGVSRETYDEFRAAPSKGKFVWSDIRGKYPYQRVS